MKIILMGPPGSGKGTQAKILSEKFNIVHISTGDMLRNEIKSESKLGKLASKIINSGNFLSDELISDIVKERISRPDCANGFILDGFPRTIKQADILKTFCDVNKVICLDVNEKKIVERLSSRVTCRDCNGTFSIYDGLKDCPSCGGKLYQRDDDKKEVIENRLKVYNEQTNPLVQYYENMKILFKIDADKSIDDVFNDICNILK